MHTNGCSLIEISMEIRMIKFWIVISESCVTVRETHFSIVVDIICPPGLNRVNLSISRREAPFVPPGSDSPVAWIQ